MIAEHKDYNLLQVMEKGRRLIRNEHQSAIVIMGVVGAGKSATYNWILGKQMVGVADSEEVNILYKSESANENPARMGQGFAGTTFCPNIEELRGQQKVSLIDMPAFNFGNDYVGVLGSAYFFQEVFTHFHKIRFLITICEQKFIDRSGAGILQTLTSFLNLFNISFMPSEIKKVLYASISVVITASQQSIKHNRYLQKFSRMVEQTHNIDNREMLIELVEAILKNGRLTSFPSAAENQDPPPCNLVDLLNNRNWSQINLSAFQKEYNLQLIKKLIKNQHLRLNKHQKNRFQVFIEKSVKQFCQAHIFLGSWVEGIKLSWNNIIYFWNRTGKINNNLWDFNSMFEELQAFISKNYFNISDRFCFPYTLKLHQSFKLTDFLKAGLRIFPIIDKFEYSRFQAYDFQEAIIKFPQLYEQLAVRLQHFASSEQQKRLFIHFVCVIRCSIQNFIYLYDINPEIIHDIKTCTCHNLNSSSTLNNFIQYFISRIDCALAFQLFRSFKDLQQYVTFFDYYELNYPNHSQPEFYVEHRNNIEIVYTTFYFLYYLQKKIAFYYVKAYHQLNKASIVNLPNKDEKDHQINQVFQKKMASLDTLYGMAKKLKQWSSNSIDVIILSTIAKDIKQTCQKYENLVQLNGTNQNRHHLEQIMNQIVKLAVFVIENGCLMKEWPQNASTWIRLPEDKIVDESLDQFEQLFRRANQMQKDKQLQPMIIHV